MGVTVGKGVSGGHRDPGSPWSVRPTAAARWEGHGVWGLAGRDLSAPLRHVLKLADHHAIINQMEVKTIPCGSH